MANAATNSDIDSTGGVVVPKLAGGATLPFPPRTLATSVFRLIAYPIAVRTRTSARAG